MQRWLKFGAGTLLGVGLVACGGNSDDGGANGVCSRGLSGGTVKLATTPCTGCTVTSLGSVADGSKSSYATLSYNVGSVNAMDPMNPNNGNNVPGGPSAIDANGPGTTYPPGSLVGAYMKFPTDGAMTKEALTFTTYLGGAKQETFTVFSLDGTSSPPDLAGNFYYYNIGKTGTAKSFDTVEVNVDYEGTTGQENVLLYEMCASY